jgi:hypothetical protein
MTTIDLSPPPVLSLNTLRAIKWASKKHHVEIISYDRYNRIWTLKTDRGYWSYPSLLRTIQEAWKARKQEDRLINGRKS